jgi:hypothetical protein
VFVYIHSTYPEHMCGATLVTSLYACRRLIKVAKEDAFANSGTSGVTNSSVAHINYKWPDLCATGLTISLLRFYKLIC